MREMCRTANRFWYVNIGSHLFALVGDFPLLIMHFNYLPCECLLDFSIQLCNLRLIAFGTVVSFTFLISVGCITYLMNAQHISNVGWFYLIL